MLHPSFSMNCVFHVPSFMFHRSGGQAIVIAAFFFLVISITLSLGIAHPVANQIESVRAVESGAESLYAAEGISQDVVYRLMKGMSVDTVETLGSGMATGTATTTTILDGKEVIAAGDRDRFVRRTKTQLLTGSGTSFNYGVQVGDGGVIFQNTSSVSGNLYSNGPVTGAGSNLIKGDVVSAGPSGNIQSVHATSSAYANQINSSTIDKDAYYKTISNTTVGGASHPNSPDQATTTLPISDAMIANMETDAAAGGVISAPCPYETPSAVTLGPVKINCDLNISGSDVITLKGPIWVTGNINISNSAIVKVDASLGNKSVAIIADKLTDHTDSSIITLNNSTQFQGSGTAGSFVVLISQNDRAAHGGNGSGEEAIIVQNSVTGALLVYAAHGEIHLKNSVSLKEVTAYRLRLSNSAQVVYDTGLVNLLFTTGPAGGYVFGNWREVE